MEQRRNLSIDILKFIAVLLITNSHFDEQYTSCQFLATGGAIGDVLFFFCSGYTLFLGRLGRFDAWYKRRIRRIYPSVLACALLTSFFWHYKTSLWAALITGGEWFVSCILIYYVLMYFIRKYWANHLSWVYAGTAIFIIAWYILFFEPFFSTLHTPDGVLKKWLFAVPHSGVWIYKWNYLKWAMYFLFFLMGAHVGKQELQHEHEYRLPSVLLGLFVSVFTFYGIQWTCEQYPTIECLQIVSLVPLLGVCLYMYRLAETRILLRAYNNKYCRWVVGSVGGLCLEIYLVQAWVRTTALNDLFPLNLLILFLIIVFAAYVCRTLGRLIQQTFSSEDGYRWHEIFGIMAK